MNEKKKRNFMTGAEIGNGIIWATLMLISSHLFKGSEHFWLFFNFLIIGAGVQIALLGFVSDKIFPKHKKEKQTA